MKLGRHICTECNTIYEEPNETFDAGKAKFDSLEESWKCDCGAGKDKYQPCACVELKSEQGHEDCCAHS